MEDGKVRAEEARAILSDLAGKGVLSVRVQFRHGTDPVWEAEGHGYSSRKYTTAVLDLDGGFGFVWKRQFRGSARRAVRRAEQSALDVTTDSSGKLLPVFADLYERSMDRWARQQHEPVALARWRTKRDTGHAMLSTVAKRFGRDCTVWVASRHGMPVASIVVLRSGNYAKYWRGAMDKELAGPVRANDLLQCLAIESACEDGHRYYEMGECRLNSPLARFKEKFGARIQVAPDLRMERVPITRAGEWSRHVVKKAIRFGDT